MEDSLWTYKEVAEFLRLKNVGAARSLAYSNPTFPRPLDLGSRTKRFYPDDVRNWVASKKRGVQPKRGRPMKALAITP